MAQPDAVFQKGDGGLRDTVSQTVVAVQGGNCAAPACEQPKNVRSCRVPPLRKSCETPSWD
ncbi:hypothetical protein [Sulfuricella sp. T08]|uniref:hypothetical protein n=1 Tax=Sulfuricella sp. T08 TaxID=1632857 RepID=UPI001184FEA7|nr:hypothetical protein [Sulfuricella sp. T08]